MSDKTHPRVPRFSLRQPSTTAVAAFRASNHSAPFAYAATGQSAVGHPANYQLDHNRTLLGHGEDTWLRACEALRTWKMFPRPWTVIAPTDEPIAVGLTLTMLARAHGLWWMNACRIVYLVDQPAPATPASSAPRRFGFAYGTLPAHVEEGEERFLVEMLPDGSVWYDLRAFSRPRFWPVRLAKPLARRLQRRFIRESQQSMRSATGAASA